MCYNVILTIIAIAAIDIKIVLTTMKTRFGPDCMKTSIILGLNAFLMAIMITFLIPALNKYRFTDQDAFEKEKEDNEYEMPGQDSNIIEK